MAEKKLGEVQVNSISIKEMKPGFLLLGEDGKVYTAETELDTEVVKGCFTKSESEVFKASLKEMIDDQFKVISSNVEKEFKKVKELAKNLNDGDADILKSLDDNKKLNAEEKKKFTEQIKDNNKTVQTIKKLVDNLDRRLDEVFDFYEKNYCLSTDGVEEYVDLVDEIDLSKDFSVALTVNPRSGGTIFGNDKLRIMFHSLLHPNYVSFCVNDGKENTMIEAACEKCEITPNEKLHIVLTHQGGNLVLWINGDVEEVVENQKLDGNTGTLLLGKGHKYFNGDYYDISIWDKKLDAVEVAALLDNTSTAYAKARAKWVPTKSEGLVDVIGNKKAILCNMSHRNIKPSAE